MVVSKLFQVFIEWPKPEGPREQSNFLDKWSEADFVEQEQRRDYKFFYVYLSNDFPDF